MLVILLQRGRGGGLAGAFGGGGGSSAFGAKTGDVFTWITVALAGLFIVLAVVANFVLEPDAIAAPTTAELTPAPPSEAPATSPITIPPDGSKGIGKIELLTKDGKVIPVDKDGRILPAKTEGDGETGRSQTDQNAQPKEGRVKDDKATGGDQQPPKTEGGDTPSGDQGGTEDPGQE